MTGTTLNLCVLILSLTYPPVLSSVTLKKRHALSLQAHSPTSADWQVTFQKAGEQFVPLTLNDARRQDYVFDLTAGRLVFRTPYGQPHAITTEVNWNSNKNIVWEQVVTESLRRWMVSRWR